MVERHHSEVCMQGDHLSVPLNKWKKVITYYIAQVSASFGAQDSGDLYFLQTKSGYILEDDSGHVLIWREQMYIKGKK